MPCFFMFVAIFKNVMFFLFVAIPECNLIHKNTHLKSRALNFSIYTQSLPNCCLQSWNGSWSLNSIQRINDQTKNENYLLFN